MSVKLVELPEGHQPKVFTFPGGEPHVQLNAWSGTVYLDARIRSFNDLGELLVVTDALRRKGCDEIHLHLPYFPGARQDKCQPGEALTVKVYAGLINAQGYASVRILDPHSPVTPALLDRCVVESPTYHAWKFIAPRPTGLICPDAGAQHRVEQVADSTTPHLPVLHARKVRDQKTGVILSYQLDAVPASGRWVVVDDICDGGATFKLLGQAFRAQELGAG